MVQGDINQITSEYLILSPKISNLTFALTANVELKLFSKLYDIY